MPFFTVSSARNRFRAILRIADTNFTNYFKAIALDREATYLLNGLVNTRIVDSDVHSSDSHGTTEPVFASTYLMSIHFEPRIKRLLHQQFYSIDPASRYKDRNYPLKPGVGLILNV